jgi:hypothetical protein
MYWDVVEVKPEPGYSLFVRFKDGLTGHVQLEREGLTVDLAPGHAIYAAIAACGVATLTASQPSGWLDQLESWSAAWKGCPTRTRLLRPGAPRVYAGALATGFRSSCGGPRCARIEFPVTRY